MAFITAARWFALGTLTVVAVNMIQSDGLPAAGKILAAMAPVALAQAATTVLFRFVPTVEANYYASGLSRPFLGGAGQALTTEQGYNNVVALERAGGFLFVSVNRASLVMGIMLVTYLAYAALARKRWPIWVALPLAGAIVATGSKTGLALLIVMPLFAFFLARAAGSQRPAGRIGAVLVALVVAVVGAQVFLSTADEYVQASADTLTPRLILWGAALNAIGGSPVFGLGFGNWTRELEAGTFVLGFSSRPVHNWLLQAWLDGGLGFATANVALVIVVLTIMLRAQTVNATKHERLGFALAGTAFLWAFVHGLGDNSSVIGDPQNLVFLILAGGVLLNAQILASPRAGTAPQFAIANARM
ncbi:O-antigen ligase family protein [Microbacterium kunmingense]|uniref:O-antigen ligase family protein n=1 Tax=Microbacterium kunmingense TaxID=2915939 RepID=UPI0020048951|nr:O-antigen ligase family protein [Microbacterium kunmingense]